MAERAGPGIGGRPRPVRLLLRGRPGVGKSTMAARIASRMASRGWSVAGFTTAEIREQGRRAGFRVDAIDGGGAVLAHTALPGPPRVGKYGVDLAAFERIALPSLDSAADLVIVDELGKMELASAPFRAAVLRVLDRAGPFVGTVHAFSHPFTDELAGRPDVLLLDVDVGNRDHIATDVVERLTAGA